MESKEFIREKLKQEGKDSANNSENEEEKDAREAKEEQQKQELIRYNYLGDEACPIFPDEDEINYCMEFRIPNI